MSRRGTLPVARLPAVGSAVVDPCRFHVVPASTEPRRVRCAWCLWEATAVGRDVELRLRVMQRAHDAVWHDDRLFS